jgi:hypothetical protein
MLEPLWFASTCHHNGSETMTTRDVTLTPWITDGHEFTVGNVRGTVIRDADKKRWKVTIEGNANPRAWREVRMPFKRGRVVRSVVIEAIAAFPGDPQPIQNGTEMFWGSSHTIA